MANLSAIVQRLTLLFVCLTALATTPAPSPTPPPQIYHVVTTQFCSRVHDIVRPAVALVLQNDERLAKGGPLFEQYRRGMLESGSNRLSDQTPQTEMTEQRMSYLVIPTAKNLISAQTLLDDPKLVAPTGNADDDAALALMRNQLLETVAFQSASLDLINGFVQTQQLGEMQHQGFEYIKQIQGDDANNPIEQATPNPWQDPNTPGISPNPYSLDLTAIPGLVMGYNPISSVIDGMHWLQTETGKREDAAGKTIMQAMSQCRT